VNVFETYGTSSMFVAFFISIPHLPIPPFHKNLKSIALWIWLDRPKTMFEDQTGKKNKILRSDKVKWIPRVLVYK